MSHSDESFPSEPSEVPVYYHNPYDYQYYPSQEPFPSTYPAYIDTSLPPVFNSIDDNVAYAQSSFPPEASENISSTSSQGTHETFVSSSPSQGTPHESFVSSSPSQGTPHETFLSSPPSHGTPHGTPEDLISTASPYNSDFGLPFPEPGPSTASVAAENFIPYHDVRLKANIDPASLERHLLLISSRPKLYRCLACMTSEVLKGTQVARAHVYRHLFGASKPYVCRTCHVEFASERAAERHRRCQEKKHLCRLCGRPFARKDARRAHESKGKCTVRSLAGFPTEINQ